MDENERRALYEQQTTELYAGLGRFVATFELLVDTLRTNLMQVWDGGSLHRQKLIRPALAELTAYPIVNVFKATMAEAIQMFVEDESERELALKILGNITNRIRDMVEVRNEIVHGTWFIGWASADQTDFSEATGFKPTNTKSGVEHRNISRTKAEFDLLVDQCQMLTALANRIWLVQRLSRPIATNFLWDGKKVSLERSMWTFSPLTPGYTG